MTKRLTEDQKRADRRAREITREIRRQYGDKVSPSSPFANRPRLPRQSREIARGG
jgi:hypothetical protein